MSKFNKKSAGTKTTNLAGGNAYKEDPKLELASILLTSFVQDKFYRSAGGEVKRIRELIPFSPLFAAKAALFARKEYGMRSVSHVVAGEIGKLVKGEPWTKRFYSKLVKRPDDMTETLSYYLSKYGKPIPNSMKKGFRHKLQKLDAYQLGKYKCEGKAVKMVDMINLLHPKHSNAIGKLVKGELESAKTWEVGLTQAGQKAKNKEEKAELKKEVWKDLIDSGKINYFALLRNLRNLIEQADDETFGKALKLLVDEKLIKDSLVLPFRFTTAAGEISKVNGKRARDALVAIADACEISLSNVPVFEGRTLVALDASGSMTNNNKEGKSPLEIASLFAAVLCQANGADLMFFADKVYEKQVTFNPRDSLLTVARLIDKAGGRIGKGTNFNCIFDGNNAAYDRIIILSDMQGWKGRGFYDQNGCGAPKGSYSDYRKRTGADPKIYSFDFQGYGTLQFPQRNIFCLAGFSEKVFEVMNMLEEDRQALVNKIEAIQI